MEVVFEEFKRAYDQNDGKRVAACFRPVAPSIRANSRRITHSPNFSTQVVWNDVRAHLTLDRPTFSRAKQEFWTHAFAVYFTALHKLILASSVPLEQRLGHDREIQDCRKLWDDAYEAWKEFSNVILRGFSTNILTIWLLPCLYVAANYLRVLAIRADTFAAAVKADTSQDAFTCNDRLSKAVSLDLEFGEEGKLEDAVRQINRMFGLCISDRAPLEESRKWGIIYIANLLFKAYFRLNSLSLCKNILKSLKASSADMPTLEDYPKAHRVTFLYYSGLVYFLEENYFEAEKYLAQAWELCLKTHVKNCERILTYLIPSRIVTTHKLPAKSLLLQYADVRTLYEGIVASVKLGNLAQFDALMERYQSELLRYRVYLCVERFRELALRNLFRKVFLVGGWETNTNGDERVRRTRIPVNEFTAALRIALRNTHVKSVDRDETECILANLIYKDLIRGYIAREAGMVVLSKKGAFPGTGI